MNVGAPILAVDDAPESLALLLKILAPAGYEVRSANSGESALAAVDASPPDLILLDVRMNGLDRFELCRRLKAREETRPIPIILISAFADAEEWTEGLQAGAADYITRPFQAEELLTRVKTHLALRGANVSLGQQAAALRQANEQLQSGMVRSQRVEDELRENLDRAERSRRALLSALEDQKRAEKTLQEREQQLRLITDNTRDTIWLMDLGMRTIWISPSVVRTRGYTLAELAEMPMDRHVAPGSLASMTKFSAAHMAPERLADPNAEIVVSEELEFYCKDGCTYWEDSVITLLRDKNGNPSGFLGVGREITERKRAEQSLEASEKRYRRLFEAAKDGILILDAETGRIVDVNPFLISLTGYSRENFLGKHLWEIGALNDMAASRDSFVKLQTEKYVRHDDLPLKALNGQRIDVEFVSNVYRIDNQDVIQCNIRDITERKRAADALRASERRFRTFLDSTTDMVFLEDEQRRTVFANKAQLAFLGRTESETIGRAVFDSLPGLAALPGDGTDEPLRPDQVTVSQDVLGDRQYEILTFPVDLGDARTGIGGFIRDVTERKRSEEERRRLQAQMAQSQRLESIGTLASGVAHEINNPLNIVMNFGQLILDDQGASDTLRTHASAIISQSERMATIVQNLLAFSRDEKETHSLADVGTFIDNTLSLFRSSLCKDQIEIVTQIPDGLPKIRCRSQQIQQVLMNLLSNARDALNAGCPGASPDKEIRIVVQPFDRGGEGWIRLTVADKGIGLPPEIAGCVFDLFFTTKPKGVGTGLGLSISYGIVKEHGGEIWFESQPGAGAQFHVELKVDSGWSPRGLSDKSSEV